MGKNSNSYKILVVDDDKFFLKLFEKYFKPPNYHIETAKNGTEGLQKAESLQPDLIISDVLMDDMDGYSFCKAIRKNTLFNRTILLLSSAVFTDVKDTVKGFKVGADGFLVKPLNLEQAKAQIDAFLRIKQLQDDLQYKNDKLVAMTKVQSKQQKKLEQAYRAQANEQKRLKTYLQEISYLVDELEQSHNHQLTLNQKLKSNFDNMVTLLSTIVALHNPLHKGHTQKVAEITKFIAGRFGLSEGVVRDIEIAALLHEIGMIGIPDEILRKDRTEYSPEEQKTITQHPLVGESLLKGYSDLEQVAKIIRHLHENIDGSGYPDGLAGDDIPIGSQIIKVVSRFERMTAKTIDISGIYDVVSSLLELANIEYKEQVVHFLRGYVDTFVDRRKYDRTEIVNIYDLEVGMILSSDLFTSTGIKLMAEGTILSNASIKCILNYHKTDSLDQQIAINIQ